MVTSTTRGSNLIATNSHCTKQLYLANSLSNLSKEDQINTVLYSISSNQDYTEICDPNDQQIHLIYNKTKEIKHSKKSKAQYVQICPFDTKLLLAAQVRIAVVDIDEKSQEIFTLSDLPDNRLPIEFSQWIDAQTIIFSNIQGVFLWRYKEASPLKLFKIPNAENYQTYHISYNTSITSIVVCLKRLSDNKTCAYFWVKDSETGQLIDHDLVVLYDSIWETECDILLSVRKVSNKLLIVLRSRKPSGGSVPELNIDKELGMTNADDSPCMLIKCPRYTLVYLITKFGEVFVADLHLKKFFYSYKLQNNVEIIKVVPNSLAGGFIAFTVKGEILSSEINERFAEEQMRNCIEDKKYLKELIKRGNFTNNLISEYLPKLEDLLESKKFAEAISFIFHTSDDVLRDRIVLNKFASAVGYKQPLLTNYVKLVRSQGSLNYEESHWLVELSQNQPMFLKIIEKLLEEEKFFCTEELGDMVFLDSNDDESDVALSIYLRSMANFKVCGCLALKDKTEQLNNFISLTLKADESLLDAISYLKNFDLKMLRKLLEFYFNKGKKKNLTSISSNTVNDFRDLIMYICNSKYFAQIFDLIECHCMDSNGILPISHDTFLDVLIEQNSIALASLIHKSNYFSNLSISDLKTKVIDARGEEYGMLFETNFAAIKQYLSNMKSGMNLEVFSFVLSQITGEDIINILEILLLNDSIAERVYLFEEIVCNFSSKYSFHSISNMFRKHNSLQILNGILEANIFGGKKTLQNCGLVDQFIEISFELKQTSQIEKAIDCGLKIDYEKFKKLIIADRPFNVQLFAKYCENKNMLDEFVLTLISQDQKSYIEYYASRADPSKFPDIICAMVKSNNFSDETLQNIIESFDVKYSIVDFYMKLDKLNKLTLIYSLLENIFHEESSTEPEHHTVLAMYSVLQNRNPERYLTSDKLYDPEIVGDYCCKFDTKLASIAYQLGGLDNKIFELATLTQNYDILIEFCYNKNDIDTWKRCLDSFYQYSNENGENIDLPSKNIFCTSFIHSIQKCTNLNSLQTLVSFLENFNHLKLLFDFLHHGIVEIPNSIASNSKEFQTKLIKLAINMDPTRLRNYFSLLNKYDIDSIQPVLIKMNMLEESIIMLSNANRQLEIVKVMIDRLHDIDRAMQISSTLTDPKSLIYLANALIDDKKLENAVRIYIQINEFSNYKEVIALGMEIYSYLPLFDYLNAARRSFSDPIIDSYCIVCLAQMGNEFELTKSVADYEFCDASLAAKICFDHGNIDAAQILFEISGDYFMLAEIYLSKSEISKAIHFADKSNRTELYYKIFSVAIQKDDIQHIRYLASKCFCHYNNEIADIISAFEKNGKHRLLCSCLEEATTNNFPQNKIYQYYLISLAKFNKTKLETALLMHHSKLSSKIEVLRIFLKCACYKEAALLEELSGNSDASIVIMLDYPKQAWDHTKLMQLARHSTSNLTVKYILDFYKKYSCNDLPEVYQTLLDKSSHSNLIDMLENYKICVIELLETQYSHSDDVSVNNALISHYTEFGLSQKLKKLYKENSNFMRSFGNNLPQGNSNLNIQEIACISLMKSRKFEEAFDLIRKNGIMNQICDFCKECKESKLLVEILEWLIEENHLSLFVSASLIAVNSISLSKFKLIVWKNSCQSIIEPIEIIKMKNMEDQISAIEKKTTDVNRGNYTSSQILTSDSNRLNSQLGHRFVLDK